MAFQPGVSGNPRDRPPGGTAVAECVRKLGGPDGRVYVERLHAIAQDKRQARLAIDAIRVLLDRGYGKTPDISIQVDPSALRDLSDADLEAALRVAEKLTGG